MLEPGSDRAGSTRAHWRPGGTAAAIGTRRTLTGGHLQGTVVRMASGTP